MVCRIEESILKLWKPTKHFPLNTGPYILFNVKLVCDTAAKFWVVDDELIIKKLGEYEILNKLYWIPLLFQ